MNIYGFAGKPETAKKTRGDQYLFVNNRFIKSAYLNHAIMNAFQDLIPSDSFPMYVLFIDLDPTQVDVNVHPTKQEIKFEDEKIIYAFVQAAIKHALAQFSITPTLDFDLDTSIQQLESIQKPFTEEKRTATVSTSIYQTFTEANQAHKIDVEPDSFSSARQAETGNNFQSLGRYLTENNKPEIGGHAHPPDYDSGFTFHEGKLWQLLNTYILVPSNNNFLLVHQQSAHERIIYERLVNAMQGRPVPMQRSLFPSSIELTGADAVLLNELLPDLLTMGYSIEPFGKNTFVIQGTPADIEAGNEKTVLEKIMEQYKHFSNEIKLSRREMLMRTISMQQSIKPGVILSEKEMQHIISELFRCSQPNSSPAGRPVYLAFQKEQLDRMFMR